MKKMLFLAALTFIFLIPIVEAKTVLYVTKSSTDDPCSLLEKKDSMFCERLVLLGYEVKVINEQHVEENSATWDDYAESSDMIFLGNVNQEMINKSQVQDSFCGNIKEKLGGRVLFASMESTVIRKPSLEGCAFYSPLSFASFIYDNNTCSQMNFKVAKEGFVTEGYEVGDSIKFYSSDTTVWTNSITPDSWLTVECVPPYGPIDFYPVVSIFDKKVFWGLNNPERFTEEAWIIFDRAVEYSLGDIYWDFDAVFIPSMITKGEEFWILANITKNGKQVDGTVNFTMNELSGDMKYSDGMWMKKGLYTTKIQDYTLILEGKSEYGFQGTHSVNFKSGTLVIDMLSEEHFKPKKDYILRTRVLLNSRIYGAGVFFKLRDPDTLEIIAEDSLDCFSHECNKTIENMPDKERLLLEMTAKKDEDSKYGGIIKFLERKTIDVQINQETYKPGDTVSIQFFSEEDASIVNMTIIDPNGDKLVSINLDKETGKYWTKNYSLGTSIPNGTYKLHIGYKIGSGSFVISQEIYVLTWNSYAYINQQNFDVFEKLNLTVGLLNAYSSNLKTNVTVKFYDSDEKLKKTLSGEITGNGKYNAIYLIPEDYPDGLSTIKITLTDSYGRNETRELGFSVNQYGLTSLISVSPSTISETTAAGKTIKKIITIENSADDKDITNLIIDIPISLKNIVQIKTQPTYLAAKSKISSEVIINSGGLSSGTYSGKISFNSQVGTTELFINLKIPEDIPSNVDAQLYILDSLEENVTKIENLVDIEEVLQLIEQAKQLLNDAKSEYSDEKYELAESKYELALSKIHEISPMITGLYEQIPDYTAIIWLGAGITVVLIVILTIIKYWRRIKKAIRRALKKEHKKEKEEKQEVIYFEPKGGEYRTEYY